MNITGLICEEHFEDDLIERRRNTFVLKPNSVPTKNSNNMTNAANDNEIETTTVDDAVDSVDTVQADNNTVSTSSLLLSAKLPESTTVAAVTSALEKVKISERASCTGSHVPSTVAAAASTRAAENESGSIDPKCVNCVLKDEMIEAKNEEIKCLRIRLKKSQEKVWHLEGVKKKLKAALLETKEKLFLNEEQLENLTVCF